ncbi:Pol polyprotein, partial [Mucuna pruriens]
MPWLAKSFGQDITGPEWSQTATSTFENAQNAKSMPTTSTSLHPRYTISMHHGRSPCRASTFILVAIDYFTKWVEASSYPSVPRKTVIRFIKRDIICRYGLPAHIITDNGTNLNNKMMTELCEQFRITHHNSTPYRPKMNGAVEAANKNLKKIIQKMVVTYKDWHEILPYALHEYRTSVRTSTEATPYSLVYGIEAVLPIEVEIPSLRVLAEAKLDEAEWVQQRLD